MKTLYFAKKNYDAPHQRLFPPNFSYLFSFSVRCELSPQYFLLKDSHSMHVFCSGWPSLTCVKKNSDNNEETEGRDEGSENDYTNGDDEMMEVEKQSIRKSEAERDIGN
jgi:hypothetical protein